MSTFVQTTSAPYDLALSAAKQLQVTHDPNAQAAQKLQNLFAFFLGEFFLDTRLGIPYRQFIFVKNPDLRIVKQIFRNVILSVPWIASVVGLKLALSKARVLSYAFAAKTQSGAVITGGSGVPFVVSTQ